MGGALSGDERQAAADRLVLAWLDGQCTAASNRRSGGVPGSPGGLAVRRRRVHDADGGYPQSCSASSAGEGRRVQQRRARLYRARAEIHALSAVWYGIKEP